MLGHKKLETTWTYAHVAIEILREGVNEEEQRKAREDLAKGR
jgi:hypothetical protein